MWTMIERAGKTLDDRWMSLRRNPAVFTDLARETLESLIADMSLRTDDVLEHLATLRDWPEQLHASTAFGEPAITVFQTSDFACELYFWVNPLTAIHNHSFSGAFTVIEGLSLELTFEFVHGSSYGRGLQVGRLHRRSVDLVKPRVVQPIEPGDSLVHQVIHVTRPTLSMIIRTRHDSRVPTQLLYWPSGLVLPALDSSSPPERRKLDFVRYLARTEHPRAAELVADVVRRADDVEAAWCLMKYFDASGGNREVVDAVLSLVREPALPWRPALRQALFDQRAMSIDWSAVSSEPHRLLAALATLVGDRDQIDRVLRDYGNGSEPEPQMLRWIAQIRHSERIADAAIQLRGGPRGLVGIDLDTRDMTLLEGMLAGQSMDDIARSLASHSDTSTETARAELLAFMERCRQAPLLRPLVLLHLGRT